MSLLQLASALNNNPHLATALTYDAVVNYISLIRCLKPSIALQEASYHCDPPDSLTVSIHEFLKVCLDISDDTAKLAWAVFRDLAWTFEGTDGDIDALQHKYIKLFMEHGLSRGISLFNITPPTRVCIDPTCQQQLLANRDEHRARELGEPKSHPISVFTRAFGAVPGFTTSLYCRHCKTRYYTNYYVHEQATVRTYYSPGAFKYLQTSKHIFIATELCELFANMMVMSWTSATNCARIYNTGLSNNRVNAVVPAAFPTRLELDTKDVWNGFFLHSLLLDHEEQNTVLEVQHNAPSQAERLWPSLQSRNLRMVGPGQEHWNHACDMCCWVFEEDGIKYQICSTVTDGIAIGHPCCAVQDCPEALPHVKKWFCRPHTHLDSLCVVTTCTALASTDFRTCADPEHRKLETYYRQQGMAMFQLKHQLERAKVSQTHDSLATGDDLPSPIRALGDDEIPDLVDVEDDDDDEDHIGEGSGVQGDDDDALVDEDGVCDGKPDTGNKSVRARFGRRRTHNEELCVGSCGVILGRATFYGSEAPNGVRTFWMRLFPTKSSLPAVIWHDNNCRIRAMLNNDDEHLRTYFDQCALPVDVFHFKCKHKESDVECGRNCNPYIWPELRTPDGKWRFNSSAAEQTNAWFGGYQAIVREMQVDRYEFFLDEMIKHRNRLIVNDLQRRLKCPYIIPREVLLRGAEDISMM